MRRGGRVSIPVWHDDQQGSATAALAALLATLEVTGKSIDRIRIVLFGIGRGQCCDLSATQGLWF